ncbi:hypothetical protein [Streptomyces sp. NPDC057718]|uniref:hypothetical protein n=1 Tax=Streptomyces sp. NPDC057718 TaxID=3346225 RepID=UPI00368CB09D
MTQHFRVVMPPCPHQVMHQSFRRFHHRRGVMGEHDPEQDEDRPTQLLRPACAE